VIAIIVAASATTAPLTTPLFSTAHALFKMKKKKKKRERERVVMKARSERY